MRSIISSLITIEDKEDLNYDELEFTDDGGFVIQYNQKITIGELITEQANETAVQFVFTTPVPVVHTPAGEEDPDTVQAARLTVQSLQGNLTIENIGAPGGNGGAGGNGTPGSDAPKGSANGQGGCGGDGGAGGSGGDGGDGPTVVVQVPEDMGRLKVRIRRAPGGKGGAGGKGAQGGRNSDGSLAADGKDGRNGKDGKSGRRGCVFVNGKKVIQRDQSDT